MSPRRWVSRRDASESYSIIVYEILPSDCTTNMLFFTERKRTVVEKNFIAKLTTKIFFRRANTQFGTLSSISPTLSTSHSAFLACTYGKLGHAI